jgi:hypothetical protein
MRASPILLKDISSWLENEIQFLKNLVIHQLLHIRFSRDAFFEPDKRALLSRPNRAPHDVFDGVLSKFLEDAGCVLTAEAIQLFARRAEHKR